MWEMDRQRPEQKQAVGSKTITATSAAVAMATVNSSISSSCISSQCTKEPSTSLSVKPTDRHTVQLFQHAAIYRPQSIAAQYLHQVYQQQHFLLQTAALQQLPSRLQTLSTLQQVSVCQQQSPASSSSLVNSTGIPSKTITSPASPVPTSLDGQSQASTAAVNTVSQNAILLRKTPTNCNEAQMYLRTKMLIITPAVQSDLPAVTFCSSLPTSSQVQNLVLQSHFPGALATAHSIVLKPSTQTETMSAASSVSKTTIIDLKADKQTEASAETEPPDVTQPASDPQIIIPEYSPTPTPVEQQPSSPPDQQFKPQQVVLQQETGAAPSQLQPISLRAEPKNNTSDSPSLRNDPPATSSSSIQTSTPTAQPPPLVAAPQRRISLAQVQNQPPPPPPPLILSKLPKCHPSALHRPFLRSIQALVVRPGEVEQPVVKGLVQMPRQDLAPPQTVAVDLKMNPIRNHETPEMEIVENRANLEEKNYSSGPQRETTSTPQTHSPRENDAEDSSSVIRTQQVEPSQIPPSNPPPPPFSLSSSTLPAAEVPNQLPSAPAGLPGPDRTAHIITHLVDGFVIQEGLEPFQRQKVRSLSAAQQASLPESQEVQTNRNAIEDSPLDADQSDSPEMENSSAADVPEISKSALQSECCGGRGHAHTRLHSKRLCSTMCVKRFSVRFRKRTSAMRAGHWAQRSVVGRSRKHFLRQAQRSFRSDRPQQSSRRQEVDQQEEEEPLVPMTTRLRKQAERQRERETEQRTTGVIIISDGEGENDNTRPSQWNVEKVFSFISALPGGAEVAERFHSQEIDGQALLLLTEDHLVSTMNFKLGPALKLCAHINSLKTA